MKSPWILQRPEPGGAERKSVLFLDLSGGRREDSRSGTRPAPSRQRQRRDTLDWDELSDKVLGHWAAFRADPESLTEEPGVARAVPVLDLLGDLIDLTPARQVRATPADIDPAEVARHAEDRRKRLAGHVNSLTKAVSYGAWEPVRGVAREWRSATVSDLVRGGALEILRATPSTKDGTLEEWRAEHTGRPVLTGTDIARGEPASGEVDDLPLETSPLIEEGDVLVRVLAGGQGPMARVADDDDAGALLGRTVFLLRPDPARLDPWFLAGFLDAEDNIAGASTGSTTIQVQPGRLRVPLLPLEEQRQYGAAFRRVRELRTTALRAADLAQETADILTTGLTAGALLPPRTDSP